MSAPTVDFRKIDRLFRRRRKAPPIDFPPMNPRTFLIPVINVAADVGSTSGIEVSNSIRCAPAV
ncbi:MAG: hypothetical protein A2718_02880 [Candidatus Ryanbacteria bacterium RIFCSPHIGHO2_01_FULL_44_130]|nr:MAG: hypothetical protein A2718_02880 [Candidatus Ryanbacteria bacterium RIFCSPHIGHO2_01_FULL_44_130]